MGGCGHSVRSAKVHSIRMFSAQGIFIIKMVHISVKFILLRDFLGDLSYSQIFAFKRFHFTVSYYQLITSWSKGGFVFLLLPWLVYCPGVTFSKLLPSFGFFLLSYYLLLWIFHICARTCNLLAVTHCHHCFMLHFLCCSRDCPIFYRRKKAQKDMAEARLQLDRWNF